MKTTLRDIATKDSRDYITPEDISTALAQGSWEDVAIEFLATLGKQTEFGIEDPGLCGFLLSREREQ